MLSGTTTIITETLEIANVLGRDPGFECLVHFIKSLGDQPIKLFATAPSPAPTLSDFEEPLPYTAEDMHTLLKLDEVLGMGETPWIPVVNCDDFLMDILEKGHESGKTLEGHSSGAKGNNLVAYSTTGISSCHEAITADEALERSRLGMYVMIREGSIRRDLEAVSDIKDKIEDFRRLVLVTDGVSPEDIIRDGHMSYVVQKAIDLGFKPVNAIQMATINPAEHFSLDAVCGGISPSRDADMVIIPDITTIQCDTVISKGKIIVQDGKLLIQPQRYTPPDAILKSIHTGRKFDSADFRIPAEVNKGKVKVRVIELINDLITRETSGDLNVKNGFLEVAPDRDIIKVAVIDRYHGTGKSFTGLVRGFGLKNGAFASSYSWEGRSPLMVVGTRDEDMALAVNRIIEMQGGITVCADNKILSELPMPIGGFLADCSVEEAAQKMHNIKQSLYGFGCPLSNPYVTIQTLSGTFLPYFRITQKGLVNIKEKKLVSLIDK
jgi:adenine deaminase